MRATLSCLTLLLALSNASPFAWSATASAPVAAAGPASKAGTITVAQASITYFAQEGDTLMSIAQQYTTKRENWTTLGKLNHIEKDISIPIGTGIVIPADLLQDEPIEAKVVALSGPIAAKARDGAPTLIALGSKITEGMLLETGANGFLTIALPDASRISLPSNTRVKLGKLRTTRYTKSPRTEVLLLRGRVESRVMPLEPVKGLYEVRTPLSVAGVRGTHFRVGIIGGDKTGTEVLDGSVAVGKVKNPDALTLPRGKGNVIGERVIGPAIDLLPAPQIVMPGSQHDYTAAQFTVVPLAGANAYHVQVSTDAEAQNVIAENLSSNSRIKVDGVPNGAYFMQVSAVDKLGLEGFTRTQAFTLKAGAEPGVKAPYVDQSDSKQMTLRWIAQPGRKYNVQLARDPEFTWLLYTGMTDTPDARMSRPAFGTYYARFQSIGADGSTSPFSQVQTIIVTDQWVINDDKSRGVKDTPAGASR